MSEAVERPMPAESRGEAPGRGRLAGRRILVVGGGQDDRGQDDAPIGNGRAMCVLFLREGANVVVADRNAEAAKGTIDILARDLRTPRGNAIVNGRGAAAVVADVAKPNDIKRMVESAHAVGGLDGLVYNVGIGAGEPWLAGATPESRDRVFAVNLRGAMLTLQAAMPVLADGSSIVLISSIASMKAGSGCRHTMRRRPRLAA